LGCRFFFDQVRAGIDNQFPNLSGGSGDAVGARAAKGTIDGYGWLNSVYRIAADGIFTHNSKSAVQSVLDTKLYEILTYLSWKNACGRFDEIVNEIQKKQQK
jgi:hypothetical protein